MSDKKRTAWNSTLRPGKPLKRKTPLKRSRMKRKPKSREKWVSQYGSEDRVAWIRSQPCIITGRRPCDNVHTEAAGMGMKGPPESIVPMIREKHEELHRIGRESFEAKYDVDLEERAEYFATVWEASQ